MALCHHLVVAGRKLVSGLVIEERWMLQGMWFNLLITLGCVHSMAFGAFHMDAFLKLGLAPHQVAAVHVFFSVWNPVNDIAAGYVADEWVSRGFGSRLSLLAWAHFGWAVSTLFTFQEVGGLPVWLHYAVAIFAADGFGSLAGALQTLVLVEQTSEERQRIQIQRLNSVFGCLEWLVMAGAYGMWDSRAGFRGPFRAYLTSVCIFSLVCTLLAVRGLQRPERKLDTQALAQDGAGGQGAMSGRLCPFLKAAAAHSNFVRYVAVGAVVEFETVFFRQFDVVLLGILLVSWPSAARVLLMVGDSLCGWLSFLLTWVAERPDIGTYGVTRTTLRIRLAVCLAAAGLLAVHLSLVAAAGLGQETESQAQGGVQAFKPDLWLAGILGVLMMLCRAATRPTASFGNVIFASVIKEHSLLEAERSMPEGAVVPASMPEAADGGESVAGKYWMLRAAITKPLNSIGPVLGSTVLAAAGYHESQDNSSSSGVVTERLWWAAAALPVVVSLTVSLIVVPIWAHFTLYGARLERVSLFAEPRRSV